MVIGEVGTHPADSGGNFGGMVSVIFDNGKIFFIDNEVHPACDGWVVCGGGSCGIGIASEDSGGSGGNIGVSGLKSGQTGERSGDFREALCVGVLGKQSVTFG